MPSILYTHRISIVNRLALLLVPLWLLGCVFSPAKAQGECGVVSSINFPVSRSQFQVVQDFGVPSVR